jgi:hypothetical protein
LLGLLFSMGSLAACLMIMGPESDGGDMVVLVRRALRHCCDCMRTVREENPAQPSDGSVDTVVAT